MHAAYSHGVSFHSSIIISYCLKIVESEPKYLSKTPFSHICLIKRKLFSSNIDKNIAIQMWLYPWNRYILYYLQNKSLKTKFSVRESPFFANVCTKLDYLHLRFKNNLRVKLAGLFQQNIQRRILSRQISIFELKTCTAQYNHSIYMQTVISWLIFCSSTFVFLLPGPG